MSDKEIMGNTEELKQISEELKALSKLAKEYLSFDSEKIGRTIYCSAAKRKDDKTLKKWAVIDNRGKHNISRSP